MSRPRLLVTGASGFVGRHLLDAVKDDHRVFALARRSQSQSRAPVHPNITWFQADIADYGALEAVFRAVREAGGADVLVHLAAYYEFTGVAHVEYWRTNVHGMRNVLQLAAEAGPRSVIFPSSLAACRFPPSGEVLTEASPPDGDHIYARTKREGEAMLREFADRLPGVVVRYAAMFSDWCEYAPLFVFLRTWLSPAWNRRILGGKGLFAMPYLHVRDGVSLLLRVLERLPELPPGTVLLGSPDGAVSHRELFGMATMLYFGARQRPILLPRPLSTAGVWLRDVLGRALGVRPFERPWMTRHIDRQLSVDASRTCARLGWSPRERLGVLRRMPYLIQNLKSDPVEWHRRNQDALRKVRLRTNLVMHALLKKNARAIVERFTEAVLGSEGRHRFPGYQRAWLDEAPSDSHELLVRHLMDAVRTGEKALLVSYCHDLGERWCAMGLDVAEICAALEELNLICLRTLSREPEWKVLRDEVRDQVTMTLNWACDEVHEVYERQQALAHETSVS